MRGYDFIIVSQSDAANYAEYAQLPVDRVELFRELVFPRMVYYRGGFRSVLDVMNYFRFGSFYVDADYVRRREMFNIWNLPGFNGPHIAAYLSGAGIRTKVVNNFDSEWDLFCEAYGESGKPPLVGISTTFYLSYSEIKRLSHKIHQSYPGAKIVLGGAFVNEQAVNMGLQSFEAPMRKYGISYVLPAFNSEADLKELLLALKAGKDLRQLKNLCFIDGGDGRARDFVITPDVWNEPVLEAADNIGEGSAAAKPGHLLQLRTSSGCPFSCAFCSYPRTAHGFHIADQVEVSRGLGIISALPGLKRLVFIDDTFNVPPARFKEILACLKRLNKEWFSFLRVQFVDEETVKSMKESGCVAVYLGVESASDRILLNMNKKASRAEYLAGIRLLKKYDICTIAAIILGFPGETRETLQEDIRFIETSGTDYYTLKEFFYMKHTAVYQDRDKYGLEGLGSDWRHHTMDRKKASEAKLELFATIRNSTFIDPDTSLWQLAYLYDRGFSLSMIRGIQQEINLVIQDQLAGKFSDNTPQFDKIMRLVNAVSLE